MAYLRGHAEQVPMSEPEQGPRTWKQGIRIPTDICRGKCTTKAVASALYSDDCFFLGIHVPQLHTTLRSAGLQAVDKIRHIYSEPEPYTEPAHRAAGTG